MPCRHFKLTRDINGHGLPARIEWEYNHCEEEGTKLVTRSSLSVAIIILAFLATANISAQDELVNYGRDWNRWSNAARSIYLDGFIDGQSKTYFALRADLPPHRQEPLRNETFTFYGNEALRDVMTSLYSDPANTYVSFGSMIYVARDKLSGKDVEPMLREARKSGRGYVRPPQ